MRKIFIGTILFVVLFSPSGTNALSGVITTAARNGAFPAINLPLQ